ncbi:MAG TPA: kelch repeat-containing protein, partial [Prolixibacteraceae bacterium]|nr:kelch repeat-containing protein [Prolixibacteraceae bacterium]
MVKDYMYLKEQRIFRFLFIITLGVVVFLQSHHVAGQNYGLKFYGQEAKLDKRTELNITPDGFMKFQDEFEISFSYKITPEELNSGSSFFGYILRMINKQGDNIDLLNTPPPNSGINVVIGKTNTSLPIKYTNLGVNQWFKLRVKVLLNKDRLILYTQDSLYVQDNIGFKNKESFKIIFGANDYKQFKNSDVPSMAIKDLKVFEKGKLKYYWPLDEVKGNLTRDKQKGKEALVKNPFWLKYRHQNWQTDYTGEINGHVTVAQDIENGKIFLIGTDNLYVYSTIRKDVKKITYKNKPLSLSNSIRAIYNSLDDNIYCYNVVEMILYSLNAETGEWNRPVPLLKEEAGYQHHNSFFYEKNNSIYIFGGYGFHRYKNDIFKVDLSNRQWDKLPSIDSVFSPRYLAGLGSLNDTLYILGGYGSETGDQLINPHSYFDLFGYSIQDSSLFHKFNVPRIMDDMVVANSMWIDENSRDYYALVFEKSKFNCDLRLVRGNLAVPELDFVAESIPFKFIDVKSYADLSYDSQQNKLIAYTSYYTDSATTQINIHSINYPPNEIGTGIIESNNRKLLIIILSIVGIVLGVIIWLYLRSRKRKEVAVDVPMDAENVSEDNEDDQKVTFKGPEYHLILFGGFQVFNSEYKDITNKFSPILKELFLLILLHTFKNNKGVSSERIE